MNILNIIDHKYYYAILNKEFKNYLAKTVDNKREFIKDIKISKRTLNRIKKENEYWCNISTLINICKKLNINKTSLLKNIVKIKTKNSFPIVFKNLKFDSSFANILGHIIGDGGIHINKMENKYRPFYVNNEGVLLDSFKENIIKIFGEVKIYFRKRENHGDEIWLPTTLGNLFYKILEYEKENRKIVPDVIKNSKNKKILSSFLQALYDDEGFLYPEKRMILISQVDKDLLNDIRELVIRLGIDSNRILEHKQKNRSKMYYFSITGKENIKKFSKRINFKHPIKRKKLNLLMGKYRGVQCAA